MKTTSNIKSSTDKPGAIYKSLNKRLSIGMNINTVQRCIEGTKWWGLREYHLSSASSRLLTAHMGTSRPCAYTHTIGHWAYWTPQLIVANQSVIPPFSYPVRVTGQQR